MPILLPVEIQTSFDQDVVFRTKEGRNVKVELKEVNIYTIQGDMLKFTTRNENGKLTCNDTDSKVSHTTSITLMH